MEEDRKTVEKYVDLLEKCYIIFKNIKKMLEFLDMV